MSKKKTEFPATGTAGLRGDVGKEGKAGKFERLKKETTPAAAKETKPKGSVPAPVPTP